MRIFLGFLVAGLALGAAVWLHGWESETVHFRSSARPSYNFVPLPGQSTPKKRRAAWQDPLAVVLAFAGVGAGVALIVPALRRSPG